VHLRVNYIGPVLYAQGPGKRYTIWVQGCSIHCPGCSNVDTWDSTKGTLRSVDELVREILTKYERKEIDGVTITGGEPLDQFAPVHELCRRVFALHKRLIGAALRPVSIFMTTGYTMARIHQREQDSILNLLDIICAGPFVQSQVCSGEYKGSSNQEVYALTELGREQLTWPKVLKEVIIAPNGGAIETGFTA